MKIAKKIAGIALAVLTSTTATAGEPGTVFSQINSWGFGIGYAKSVNDNWAVRGQYNTFDFGAEFLGGFSRSEAVQLLADWYPSASSFRLSAGIVFDQSKDQLNGKILGFQVSQPYTTKQSDNPVPYLGLGYATRPKDAKGWGFTGDLGFTFNNNPSTTLDNGRGSASQADYDKFIQDHNNTYSKTKGVVGFGVSYSF